MSPRAAALLACFALGCSSTAPPVRVLAAAPPPDDGQASKGGAGGDEHSAALEQLKVAPLAPRDDRQGSVHILLPDAEHWMRVRFWGVQSLVGFRYGKEHHALVGAFVTHVDDNSVPGACRKSFEAWAMPFVEAFDVELRRDTPTAWMWRRPDWPGEAHVDNVPSPINVETVRAKTATLAMNDVYAGAWAAYPAWKGACLVVGVAVPARDDEARAIDVRDRFAREVLPRVEVMVGEEPKERY
jgi:hypothetical protein